MKKIAFIFCAFIGISCNLFGIDLAQQKNQQKTVENEQSDNRFLSKNNVIAALIFCAVIGSYCLYPHASAQQSNYTLSNPRFTQIITTPSPYDGKSMTSSMIQEYRKLCTGAF